MERLARKREDKQNFNKQSNHDMRSAIEQKKKHTTTESYYDEEEESEEEEES